jgi:hypothetical protein
MADDLNSLGSDSSSWDGFDDRVTLVFTAAEMLFEGLQLAGIDQDMQQRQPKSNVGDFVDRYGSSPTILTIVWTDLQASPHPEAFVPENKRNLSCFWSQCIF